MSDTKNILQSAIEVNKIVYDRLQTKESKIHNFCQKWQITELSVFGSILTDKFNQNSDVDILVQFAPEARISLFDLENIESELKIIFGRDVDVVSKKAIQCSRNWIRRQNILGSAQVLYVTR
ncbi:MAG: DNA polymerase subunit beta [Okeania sp. SIO2C2]|nr:DNA polymerase subunit beta [Okeania sp. SIO2C2]